MFVRHPCARRMGKTHYSVHYAGTLRALPGGQDFAATLDTPAPAADDRRRHLDNRKEGAMRTRLVPIAVALTLVLAASTAAGAARHEAQPRQCFAETGFCIAGRFLDYWLANGGLVQQGYPITDVFDEVNPTNGRTYRTQYFERARFEYHPENEPPDDVLLGLLGREQFRARYPGTYPGDTPGPQLVGPGAICFQQTGRCILPEFYDYWREHGGLAQFGLPLTFGFFETNPTDGKQYHTVYFERARFELHPENREPFTVLLGLLGVEQYRSKYPTSIVDR